MDDSGELNHHEVTVAVASEIELWGPEGCHQQRRSGGGYEGTLQVKGRGAYRCKGGSMTWKKSEIGSQQMSYG